MEYPGYGVYDGQPSEQRMCRDAVRVFDYLTKNLLISNKSISVLGRSMGSGPAIHLSSVRDPAHCILVSPYTSIRRVTSDLLGNFLSSLLLIKERFENLRVIPGVDCPLLLIHGQKDKLVKVANSHELAEAAVSSAGVELVVNEEMGHNEFNLYIEIVNPIYEFFKKEGFSERASGCIKTQCLLSFHRIIEKFLEVLERRSTSEQGTKSSVE